MKKGKRIEIKQNSFGEQIIEDLTFVAIGCFVLYLICGFFKVIFWPVRYLFMSSEEIDRDDIIKAKKKVRMRNQRNLKFRDDSGDPLNQYIDKGLNKEWYESWKNGDILDSLLKWTPEVYNESKGKRSINTDWVDYMENQTDLHKNAPWSSKYLFLSTIRKYYPELTPSFTGIDNDLALLKKRVKKNKVKRKFANEIHKLGIPQKYADMLVNSDFNGDEVREKAKIIKKGLERDFCERAIVAILNNDINPASREASELNDCMKDSDDFPESVYIARIRNEIDDSDLWILVDRAKELIVEYDSHTSEYFEGLETKLKQIIRGKKTKWSS